MGFTVTHQGGTKDAEFEEYARLLRQQGADLAKLPRVPEPGTGRPWLHVWQHRDAARAFADELKKRTRDEAWQVVEVDGQPSEGPLGPVEVRVSQQSDGWAFALHPLSRQMIQRVFPATCRTSTVFIHRESRRDVQASQEDFATLAPPVVSILTGLPLDQITGTFGGFRVYDPVAKKELVAPAPVQGSLGGPDSGGNGNGKSG